MVRLTADLIWKSPHFFNAIKERELDLRGNKIAVVENLGATEVSSAPAASFTFQNLYAHLHWHCQSIREEARVCRIKGLCAFLLEDYDQFDTIDLSDNEIVKLENFPYLNRLGTLLSAPRLTIILVNFSHVEFLPKLHTLVLTNNRLTNLAEIDPLASLPKLQYLSLLDNTVTKQPDYRLYVIHKLKHLRLLDFKKVKQQERVAAAQKFHSKEAEEEAKKAPVKTFTPGQLDAEDTTNVHAPKVVAPTPEQITAIKAAIANTHTLEEAARLEKALSSGQVPAEFAMPKPDANMAEAAEEADKMDTDGQSEADGHKQDDESTPIQEVVYPSTLNLFPTW
ncbi:hypothetical protein HU200_030187 [Digitaria exilis]|uniref:Uncharacterized protein n=1 Tax=Digitaria exilis TaxID=1010633 RepID=A0A835ERH5_9POAL|nr:hypothetical protein HU200_030187 [Digitaria exilis]